MSKLPRTDELPHAEEGFDPARVEEAFATFADRVRELESVASELRAELHSLRVERSGPRRFGEESRFDEEDWPAVTGLAGGELPSAAHMSADWIATVPAPLARGLTVPRFALEGVFLLLVAVLAGLADLGPAWIVLVMVVAWALVALAEWAAAAKRSRWRLDEVAPAVVVPGPDAPDSTGPWDMPVVESTAVDSPEPDSESKTIVTKLPENSAGRRLGLRRRKQPAEATADPWET